MDRSIFGDIVRRLKSYGIESVYKLCNLDDTFSSEMRTGVLLEHLAGTTFFTDPASSKYHCSYPGGLYDHSFNVLKNLCMLTRLHKLEWEDPESPMIIGIAHDLCKVGAYVLDENGEYQWNRVQPEGHGTLSFTRAARYIDLTEEERYCIENHMGAFVPREEWKEYTDAIVRHPNVLWTHQADMMATYFDEEGMIQ